MPIFGHKNCSILRGKILESGEASAKYFLPFAHCPLANVCMYFFIYQTSFYTCLVIIPLVKLIDLDSIQFRI